jgi:hypothetical protein
MITLNSQTRVFISSISFLQNTLWRTYGPLAQYAAAMGDQVLKGVRTMETKKEKVSFYTFRPLEGLLTPDARSEVLYVFADNELTPMMLEKGIREARHRMWCRFVWEMHPEISDEHRMPHTLYSQDKIPW